MTIIDKDMALIDGFLRGELNKKELSAFQLKLDTDKPFASRFEQMKAIREGIRQSALQDKLSMLQQYEKELQKDEAKQAIIKKPAMRKRYAIGFGIAAALLWMIIFMPGIFPGKTDNEILAMQYFEHYPAEVLKRSDGQDLSALKQKAYELYGFGDYEKAAPVLAELCDNGDKYSCFFTGVALSGAGKSEQAIKYFEMEGLPFEKDVIYWYNGLTYWSLGEEEKAKEVWQKIDKQNRHNKTVNDLLNHKK